MHVGIRQPCKREKIKLKLNNNNKARKLYFQHLLKVKYTSGIKLIEKFEFGFRLTHTQIKIKRAIVIFF